VRQFTSLKNSTGLFFRGLGTWNCNLYRPSQSSPFVNEKIKFKATPKILDVKKRTLDNFVIQIVHVMNLTESHRRYNFDKSCILEFQQNVMNLPCLGTHIWMEYIGESALPLSFLSITFGAPPHIIGWLNPPKHMKK
jgi:hypothetical protein